MPEYEVILKKVAPQKVVAIRETLPNYSATGQLFGKIVPYLFQVGAQMSGPPIGIFHDEEFKESDVDVEVAFPVAAAVPAEGAFACKDLPGYDQMATTIHRGSYDTVSAAYTALMRWIEGNDYQITGPSREVYFSDPNTTPPSEWVTEIQFPVAKAKA